VEISALHLERGTGRGGYDDYRELHVVGRIVFSISDEGTPGRIGRGVTG
jgi:hypothetical protein